MIERVRRIPSVVVFVAALVAVPAFVVAAVQSINAEVVGHQDWPLVIGYNVKYIVVPVPVPPGPAVTMVSLQYQCLSGGIGTMVPDPALTGNASWTFIEQRAGSQNIRGGTFESDLTAFPPQPGAWVYGTKFITILLPDTEFQATGLYADSTYDAASDLMSIECQFRLYYGPFVVGPGIDCYVEEQIRTATETSAWSGDDGSGRYTFVSPVIIDKKSISGTASDIWLSIPVGGVISEFWQTNRIGINDCRTGFHYQLVTFPEHHYQKIKTSATSWKLVVL